LRWWSTRTDSANKYQNKTGKVGGVAPFAIGIYVWWEPDLLRYVTLHLVVLVRVGSSSSYFFKSAPDFTSYNAVDRFININRQPNKYHGKPRSKVLSRLAGEVRVDGDDETQRKEHELELELELELEIRGVGSHLATSSTMLLPPA
jgi:hypothetical protein